MSGIEDGSDYTDLTAAELIELALKNNEVALTDTGAVYTTTGVRTGRAPADRYIVREPSSEDLIDWGTVNQPFSPVAFDALWNRVKDYLSGVDNYISHLHIGACEDHYLPLIITTETAWHSLFAQNMFVRPNKSYNCKDKRRWKILHAANFVCDPARDGTRSDGCVIINFSQRKVLLAGMKYAGELKKSMFSVQNFLLPERDVLPMHCAANVGVDEQGDSETCLFFGLSGTGKTTLSTDPKRYLIGDDEHGWARGKVFNFEGGCYAKTIDLSKNNEPLIWQAIRYGATVENVVVDERLRIADYSNTEFGENGRCSYPLHHIKQRVEANFSAEAKYVIFLTCDLSGVLPPVSILTKEAAAYHFLSGYTAKIASTEGSANSDVLEETIAPTFSACFGAPFMPRPARVYADLLMRRIESFGSRVFLVNTGWYGGSGVKGVDGKSVGQRFSIAKTRTIISAIQAGELDDIKTESLDILNLSIPLQVIGIESSVLNPRDSWEDKMAYDVEAKKLAELFVKNMQRFSISDAIKSAGPKV